MRRLLGLLLRLAVHANRAGILGGLLGGILGLLGRGRRHDAVVMLCMLKIILGHDAVAAGIGVAGQLQILLIDVGGRTANLDLGTGRIIGAVGIETTAAAAIVVAAAATAAIATVLRPAAASARAFHYGPSFVPLR